MAEKIIGVYRIINTITGDSYIGSSKDVKRRWRDHLRPYTWKQHQNNPMYHDIQKYGKDKFELQILAEVEPEHLKESEQQFIENMKPTYNDKNAKGLNIKRRKEYNREYKRSDKYKKYQKTDKQREYHNKYYNQLCSYNGETLTLNALSARFRKAGIEHPTKEAKKYLVL